MHLKTKSLPLALEWIKFLIFKPPEDWILQHKGNVWKTKDRASEGIILVALQMIGFLCFI